MAVDIAGALSAYNRVARQETGEGLGARPLPPGQDFAGLLQDAAEQAIDTMREGERQSLKAAAGTADITEVVTAMAQAELTLQTVVTLRDRIIQSYQEILRMPV